MTWAWLASEPYRMPAGSAPETPVALVLGAGVAGGRPTGMLALRLDVAADLYARGRVRALLLSGDNGRAGYDEPTVMRDYLVAKGVPGNRIVRDYAGFDTWDSCVRARRVFGASRLTVVTQGFHLPRAVTLCRLAGLTAYGVADDRSARLWPEKTWVYAAREFFATGKAFLDAVVLRSEPRFLGPREPGLADALRAG
ncbi:hypothetical protein D5H75_05025 [Bailinhaonella thermotolerans]|uniref:DUF218 domain-containing protein n=2 Tax=Bailinhaonella thermotolerans TaxID=1070861 RepID=A0A3A4BCN0_9ACTN|nr:hypothetical protein D5H75_05025 [Bailinhaonella thermotolerans]